MTPPPVQFFSPELEYQRYLDGLLRHDREQCRLSFEQWLAATPELRSLYEELVRRSLYEVGTRWEQGQISVATEHLATAISEGLLNLTYPRLFARPRVNKSAVVACVASEYHQIGSKMVADVFELCGWRGYFLGANTPLSALLALIAEKQPNVAALSAATTYALDPLVAAVTEIRAAFPALPVLVGGQAFRWGGSERFAALPGVRCLKSLGELEAWIQVPENHV